ncbi:MAG: DegV family protein, partial [Coriobacteriia bacterium]|nr:DegV family protein [Coriobacteriia bacterium]
LGKTDPEGVDWVIAPLTVIVGEKEFVDDDNLDVDEMMSEMKAYQGPTTSACPSVGTYAESFRRAKNTICVTITSQLSASYESALQAKEMVEAEDPTRNIHVVDSRATSGKMTLIAEEAERLIKKGLSFSEVARLADEARDSIMLFFSLASFDNLIKNGRMPKYQGMLGQILKMRPVAYATKEGTIEILDKPRGEKAMLRKMVERMQEFRNLEDKSVIISHCNAEEVALKLKEKLEETANLKSIRVMPTRGLCSFYTDEGGFIVGY